MNETLEETTFDYYPPLVLADRCDRCNEASQAFVRFIATYDDKTMDLLFCGHHANKYEPALIAQGWNIYQDARSSINEKPMSGSNYEE